MGAGGGARAGQVTRAGAAFRRNLLLVVATLAYLAAVVALAILMDTLGFMPAKREVIQRYYEEGDRVFDHQQGDRLIQQAQSFLRGFPASADKKDPRRAALENLMDEVLDGNPAVVEVEVAREGATIVSKARPERVLELNTWETALLSRDFRFKVTRAPDVNNRRLGIVRVYLTTPAVTPELTELVATWRAYLVLTIFGITAVYLTILFGLILPIRRVSRIMETPEGASAIIARPRSSLERIYNELARDATLARFATDLREASELASGAGTAALLERIPDLAGRRTGLSGFQAVTLRHAGGRWALASSVAQSDCAWIGGGAFTTALERHLLSQPPTGGEDNDHRLLSWTDGAGRLRHTVVVPLDASGEAAALLAVHAAPPHHQQPPPWWRDYYGRLGAEVRVAIRSMETRSRLILQEKSKANISLSRNLGHDLTNIIATAKLELMTVRSFLRLTPEEIASAPQKRGIFAEALSSLLNQIRFMQEVVNLYRSFAYLQRPKFESVSLEELARDTAELFRLSISAKVVVVAPGESASPLPALEVEPRLLRLALFNLMTNALDAIKRGSTANQTEGTIRIEVTEGPNPGEQQIIVSDTGPGIRDAAGRLLDPDEIAGIFRLGYTTKEAGEGEGLGLNWVQTIVRDFHGGLILASNLPGGGAQFVLRLPRGRGQCEAAGAVESSGDTEAAPRSQPTGSLNA